MENKLTTKKIGIVVILVMSVVSFLVSISTVYAGSFKDNSKLDVRFVVDVSYVMNKVDPSNSRVRALQKIIKSIPDNSKAGVWTYGKYVNMLVPVGNVDNAWKKKAVFKLDKIGSYGNYRNLGRAIEEAAYGWQSNSEYNKYIVVVTNGDFRVSQSKVKNASAQLALLTKTLAKLKKANIEIHTVSLGKEADNRLLKILAQQTNGNWYQVSNIKSLPNVLNHVYTVVASNHNNKQFIAQSLKKDLQKIQKQSEVLTSASGDTETNSTWTKLENKITSRKIVTAKNNAVDKNKAVTSKKLNTEYKAKTVKRSSGKSNSDKIIKTEDFEKRKAMDFNWPSA